MRAWRATRSSGAPAPASRPWAQRLARALDAAHLDLDTVAAHEHWITDGCYADVVATALPRLTCLVLLNPGVDACVANARARPWEPHKYTTPAVQEVELTSRAAIASFAPAAGSG